MNCFCAQELKLGIGESYTLKIQFDPAYKDDCHIRTVDEVLSVAYKEHPHVVSKGHYQFLLFDEQCVYYYFLSPRAFTLAQNLPKGKLKMCVT